MFLSIILGALLYALIQSLWYSPLLFGREWLSLKQLTPETALETSSLGGGMPTTLQSLIFPAILMSLAIHALALVLSGIDPSLFWGGVVLMFLTTALPKYRHWPRIEADTRSLHFLGDGALAASLLLLTLFVLWSSHTLY